MRLQLRCCISYSERKQRMMIELWIDRKLEEIISPGTKSFPIFNDFERNYFFGFKSEPSFSPPSSVWTWQSLSVCLALIVLLVFLVIELDYLPSVLQYLSTRRKHLGDFNYVHFLWVWQCIMFIWKHIIGSHYSIQEDFRLHTTLICKNPYRKLCGRLLDHDDRFKMRIDIGWVLKYWIS